MLRDPNLPALYDLLSLPAARPILEAALGDEPVEIDDLRIVDVSYRPGSRAVVRYQVRLQSPSGEASEASFIAWTGTRIPSGGLRLQSGSAEVGLWRYPDDPRLPGLATAASPAPLGAVLAGLGLQGVPAIRLRAYRPGRRAVFEAAVGERRLFVKVVRPRRVAELQALHRTLAEVVPVPRSHGWSPELGLVVLEALPGQALSHLLARGDAASVPDARDLEELLDRIAGCELTTRDRAPSIERIGEHAGLLSGILPAAASILDDIVELAGEPRPVPSITAHRDFHAGQLMMHDGAMGLVDIDTVGMGSRADDAAMFLAQLVCLARSGPAAPSIEEYVRVLTAGFGLEPAALGQRVAASLLGFAVGPFRVGEPGWEAETRRRIEAAATWVSRPVSSH